MQTAQATLEDQKEKTSELQEKQKIKFQRKKTSKPSQFITNMICPDILYVRLCTIDTFALIIIDIDDLILTSLKQKFLASTEFLCDLYKEYPGYKSLLDPFLSFIYSKIQLSDKDLPDIIKKCHNDPSTQLVMMTSRGIDWIERTEQLLDSVGIKLEDQNLEGKPLHTLNHLSWTYNARQNIIQTISIKFPYIFQNYLSKPQVLHQIMDDKTVIKLPRVSELKPAFHQVIILDSKPENVEGKESLTETFNKVLMKSDKFCVFKASTEYIYVNYDAANEPCEPYTFANAISQLNILIQEHKNDNVFVELLATDEFTKLIVEKQQLLLKSTENNETEQLAGSLDHLAIDKNDNIVTD